MSSLDRLRQVQKTVSRERLQFPLAKIQIDQEQGKFRVYKDGQVLGHMDEIQIVVLDRWNEYYKYDPKLKRRVIASTIEKLASQCKDKVTGQLISKIKEQDDDIVMMSHLVSILLNHETVKQAVVQLHGSGIQQFIDFTNKNKSYWNDARYLTKLVVRLVQAKNGRIVYWQPVFKMQELTEAEGDIVVQNFENALDVFSKFVSAYNSRKLELTETEQDTGTQEDEYYPEDF